MTTLTKEEKLIVKLAKSVTNDDIRLCEADFENIDWNAVMTLLKSQKLFLLLFDKISDFLPSNVYHLYKAEYQQMKEKVDRSILVAKKISDEFDFSCCIVKGFILSQILYGNAYHRDFSDIDFLMNEDKIVEASYILEKLSFRERNLAELEKYTDVPEFAKELFYNIDFEKQFVNDNLKVEVKSFASNEYGKNDVKIALVNTQSVYVNNIEFITIDLRETFIYLLTNTYTNFMSDWGIHCDYRIRDIVDFKQFVDKYSYVLTSDLIEYIRERGKIGMLYEVLQILNTFYYDLGLSNTILNSITTTEKQESIFGDVSLFTLIFDRNKRSQLYDDHIAMRSAKQRAYQEIDATKIDSLIHYDYENGMVQAQYPIWPNNSTVLNITGSIILSGVDYDDNYLFVNIKIPKNYPELCTKLQIISSVENQFVIFHLNTTGVIVQETNAAGCYVIHTEFEYYRVVTVKIPRHESIEFMEEENKYVYFCYDMCVGNRYNPFGQKIAMWGSNNYYLRINLK